MHDPIDPVLRHLTTMATPSALDTIEGDVLAAIDEQTRGRRTGRRVGTWSVGAALAVGIVGSGIVGGGGIAPAYAAAPIGMDTALAPSTLLLGR